MDTNTCLIDSLEENKEKEFIYEIIEEYARIITDLYLRIDKAIKKIDSIFNVGDENKIIDDLLELDSILKGEENGK